MYNCQNNKTSGPTGTEQRAQRQLHIQIGTYTVKVILQSWEMMSF